MPEPCRRTESLPSLARAAAQQADALRLWGVRDLPLTGVRSLTGSDPSSLDDRTTVLRAIEREVAACRLCPLYRTRTHPVLSDGDPRARLVFVGEAPGREEDLRGVPFVGAAGQLLTKMIEAIGLRREQVYICNVLKDRPPNNRVPLPEEVEACRPYLIRQLEAVRPAVICVLGAVAARALLGPGASISSLRGRPHEFLGAVLVPTFHPAYLLRNPSAKKLVWQDLKLVKRLLEKAVSSRQ